MTIRILKQILMTVSFIEFEINLSNFLCWF